VLPDESATVQVTVVMPIGKQLPLGGVHTGAPTPGQLSVTVGAGKVAVTQLPVGTPVAVKLLGHTMFGGC